MKIYKEILEYYTNRFKADTKKETECEYGIGEPDFKIKPMGMVDPYDPHNQEILENFRSSEEAALSRHQWRDHYHLTIFTRDCEWWEPVKAKFDNLYAEHIDPGREKCDLEDLLAKQKSPDREERLFNISSEVVDITPRFTEICLFDGHTHPNTYRLMRTAELIGGVLSMTFKQEYKRERPSFTHPEVDPIIRVPSHPSWPAGHAVQATMVGFVLALVVGPYSEKRPVALSDLAMDIGENRVWAGVHYAADITAGENLALELAAAWVNHILDIPGSPLARIIEDARAEWDWPTGS